MVGLPIGIAGVIPKLSVLALSSRFDGHSTGNAERTLQFLSVLALSSRFDGPLDDACAS